MEMLAPLKQFIQKIPTKSIGICHRENRLLAVYLEREEDGWCLSAADELEVMDGEETVERNVTAALRMHCARNGWDMGYLALCMLEEELFTGKADLPELETEEALVEAVRWEVESRDFFGDEEFRSVFLREAEGIYWIAGIEGRKAAAWESAWQDEALERFDLTAMPPLEDSLEYGDNTVFFAGNELRMGKRMEAAKLSPGMLPALYAALLSAGRLREGCCVSFSKREASDVWNWKRIGIGAACFTALALGILAGADLWQLHEADAALQETRRELVLLDGEGQKKARIEKSQEQVAARDASLERLSRESFPWHSVLVHFGCMTVEGVFLNDIVLAEEDTLDIRGEAVTFDALAEFLKGFEEDRAFFPKGPILQSSSVSENRMPGDMVRFSLRLKM